MDSMTFPPYQGIFQAGSAASNAFTSVISSFPILALLVCFPYNVVARKDNLWFRSLGSHPCVTVGNLDYVSIGYHCMWPSRITLSVVIIIYVLRLSVRPLQRITVPMMSFFFCAVLG